MSEKYREFYINDGRVFKTEKEATNNFGEVYKTIYPIHVIEISAIKSKYDEISRLKKALELVRDSIEHISDDQFIVMNRSGIERAIEILNPHTHHKGV